MEKLKLGLELVLLSGIVFLLYHLRQSDAYLDQAKLEIVAAQAKIEAARSDIASTKQNLQQLDNQAVITQAQYDALRHERDSLNMLFKNTVSKHKTDIAWYRVKVDSLRAAHQQLINDLQTMDRSLHRK